MKNRSDAWRPRLYPLLALMLFLCIGAPALVSAEEVDREFAQQRFAEGRQHFEDEEYLEAVEIFMEVYDMLGAAPLLYNIGEAYRRADQLRKAEEFFQEYLNEAPDAANADVVVERIIDIQQERAARMARLRLISDPGGAQITLAGEDTCEAPCTFDVDPGDYEVTAELSDYHSLTRSVALEARQEKEITLALERETPTGYLHVRSDVEGVVLVTGEHRVTLPHRDPLELETGHQTITLHWNGEVVEHEIEIELGQSLHLFIPLESSGSAGMSTLKSSAIGLGGASLAFGLAATAAGMQARTTHEVLDSQQQSRGFVDDGLLQRGQRQQSLANGLWVGAVGSLVAGVGLWTFDALRSGGDAEPSIEPTADVDVWD